MYGYNDDENQDFNENPMKHQFLQPEEMAYMKSLDVIARMQYMHMLRLLSSSDKKMLSKRNAVLKALNIEPSTYKVTMPREKMHLLEQYYRYTLFDPNTGILN